MPDHRSRRRKPSYNSPFGSTAIYGGLPDYLRPYIVRLPGYEYPGAGHFDDSGAKDLYFVPRRKDATLAGLQRAVKDFQRELGEGLDHPERRQYPLDEMDLIRDLKEVGWYPLEVHVDMVWNAGEVVYRRT